MSTISPIINGIKYVIYNKQDYIEKVLLNGNQWNEKILTIIKLYILNKNLFHFLNVGSHIGTMSLPVSLDINKVTAIEAYPDTYKHLCENIKLNNISNVETFNLAVGNSEEDIYFMGMENICPIQRIQRVKNNSGGMAIFTDDDIKNNIRSANLTDRKIKNKMSKLDNLQIDHFDIMLVDIEGYEYEFLLGAKEKIIKYKPIIIIEIWNDHKRKQENMKTTQQEIICYIENLNYKLVTQVGDDFIFELFHI
jgi:FkbM family methyltransferase